MVQQRQYKRRATMSNGGPHGDKWNKYVGPLTDDQILTIINTPVDGYYAGSAFINPATGTLFVANYLKKGNED